VRIRCPASDAPLRVLLQATKAKRSSRVYTAGEHAQIVDGHMRRGHADSAEGVGARSGKGAHSTYDGNPLGWRAHGRNARGQADHEELAHMVVC
jgi:hypothetical protein